MKPLRVIPFLVTCLWFWLPLSTALADDWHFSGVERTVAVGDVHGAYDALVETLQVAGVIDDNLAWSGAGTHLVFTGDLLDRGADSRRVMDLIMRLEPEAVRAGGQVHQLLGNHEVMNLIGDLRYVAKGEYAAFAADESAQEREKWYQQFRRSRPDGIDETVIRSEFDKRAPPGFFGHRRAFRSDGVYGKWLLEKPFMVVVNDTAFVHGGVPPYVEEFGLAGVNGALKKDLLNYMAAQSALEDKGVLSPINPYREQPSILWPGMQSGQFDGALMASAQVIADFRKSPLQGAAGPTWYRGTATCTGLVEEDDLDSALQNIGATRVALGHTTTSTRRVQQNMDGRVIEIDTGMLKSSYQGSGNALIIEGDRLTVVSQDGAKDLSPITHPRRFGDGAFSDDVLADILTSGFVVASKPNPDGLPWRLVKVTAGEKTVFAFFTAASREKGFSPELAAYRLDRMLGLYMVPVTVRRELGGAKGTLQFVPEKVMGERERAASGQAIAPCPLDKQWGAMYVFDMLIHNPARSPLSMFYNPDDLQLMLANHESSFSTEKQRPDYLRGIEFTVGDQWRNALLELDDEKLRANLGDVLDKSRLAALAKRRDALIKDSNR